MSARAPAATRSKPQQVARDLIARIAESGAADGETFATEAELLRQFDVSRPTLREGLHIVESLGVLERRPGPGGGLVVRRPTLDALAHSLSVYLRFNGVPFDAVLRAREAIEPALAADAARHGTDAHFDEMAASIARMKAAEGGQAAFIAENRVFHGVVARASGNAVLETYWGALSLLAHGEHHGVRYTFGNRRHVIAAHERILDACRRRDAASAAAAMAEHLGALEHLVRDHYRHLLREPTRVREPAAVRRSPSPLPTDGTPKP